MIKIIKKTFRLGIFLLISLCILLPTEVNAAQKTPGKISSLTVTSYSHNSIKIKWKKVKYANKYQIYRSTSKNGTYKRIKTTDELLFINKGLTTGKKYYYKVRAINNSAKGKFSSIKSMAPRVSRTQILETSSTENSVTLDFKKIAGATTYQIHRSDSEDGTYKKIAFTTKQTYTDKTVIPNETYYYKVRAVKKMDDTFKYGKYSKIVGVTTKDHTYFTEIIEPTCTNKGYSLHTCEICDYSYTNNYVDALGHDYESITIDPTFTQTGYTTYTCVRCDYTYTSDYIDPVEDYIKNEVTRVTNKVNSKLSSNSFTFLLASDMHNAASGETDDETFKVINTSNLHAGQAMSLLADNVDFDFFACLGDFALGSPTTTTEQGKESISKALYYLDEVRSKTKSYLLPGNHDSLYYSKELNNGYLSDAEVASMLGNYQYTDFKEQKIRLICLNTSETIETGDDSSGSEGISGKQLQWFAQALDLSSKYDASQWGIIIISHHPLDWVTNIAAANCLQAYLNGESYEVKHHGVSVSYDFSGKNKATVIAQFHGHLHNYKEDYIHYLSNGVAKNTSVKRIGIPNTNFYRNNEYGNNDGPEYFGIEYGNTATYEKKSGTTEDTAFCAITIDTSTKTIYAYHYGAGVDRTTNYGN